MTVFPNVGLSIISPIANNTMISIGNHDTNPFMMEQLLVANSLLTMEQ